MRSLSNLAPWCTHVYLIGWRQCRYKSTLDVDVLECFSIGDGADVGASDRIPELDLDLAMLKESQLVDLPEFSGPARYVWRIQPLNVLFSCTSQEGSSSFDFLAESLVFKFFRSRPMVL